MQPQQLSASDMQTPCVCMRYSDGSTFVSPDGAGHLGQSIAVIFREQSVSVWLLVPLYHVLDTVPPAPTTVFVGNVRTMLCQSLHMYHHLAAL